jgi:sugar (pentulose or hexulose) kinase
MQNEVYLIYDIGKTNKKCLVFSDEGKVIDECSEQFAETVDEDGFACEDLNKLTEWVLGQYDLFRKNESYHIKAINFATYGASFVHIDANGKLVTPLYNYLKPFPEKIKENFLATYFNGNADEFALNTASPFMGMLNSGLQLYWLKYTQPQTWNTIQYSLHLPQYLSFLFTGKAISDYTSVGCHTGLWNVNNQMYHPWVFAEGIDKKLPPLVSSAIAGEKNEIQIGTGLHDSSSALIPYLQQYKQPFLLISTGTWCINLNPFNTEPLTPEELLKDCLCYLQVNGKPVKASRIFLGKEHEYQTKRIAHHFNVAEDFYKAISIAENTKANNFIPACMKGSGPQPQQQNTEWDLSVYQTAQHAYTALMKGLINLLQQSIGLVNNEAVNNFYIDGGFSANSLFKHFLQESFPAKKITVIEFPQATALGAYLNIKLQESLPHLTISNTAQSGL